MSDGRMVNSRISVTEETRDRIKDFANGVGGTYDSALNFLLDYIQESSEDALLAGRRLRKHYDGWKAPASDKSDK